jgi:hypothetical protein
LSTAENELLASRIPDREWNLCTIGQEIKLRAFETTVYSRRLKVLTKYFLWERKKKKKKKK